MILERRTKFHLFYSNREVRGFDLYGNEACFFCFLYNVTIGLNEFKGNKLNVSSVKIVTQRTFLILW